MFFAAQRLLASIEAQKIEISWSLASAFILAVVYRVSNAYGWALVLRSIGTRVDGALATRIWLLSEACRWIPGSIWSYLSRASMATRINVTTPVALASMLVELGLVVVSAVLVSLAGLPYFWSHVLDAIDHLGVNNLVVIGVPTFFTCGLLAVVCRKMLARKLSNLQERLRALAEVRMHIPSLGLTLVFFVIMQVFNGVVTYCIACSMHPNLDVPHVAIVVATSVAWLCGFLAFFAPGGLMVREAAFTALLMPWMSASETLTIAIVARLAQLFSEVLTTVWITLERALGMETSGPSSQQIR